MNINSVKARTNIWNLDIYEPSVLYLFCVFLFALSIYLFENKKKKKKKKIQTPELLNDYKITIRSSFGLFILIFPILLLINIYLNLGFFPILSGQSFVNDMYEFNYGALYNFKFLSVYSFCIIIIIFKKEKKIVLTSLYILFLLFTVSVDGKRFILLLSLLSILPLLIMAKRDRNFIIKKEINQNNTPIIIGGTVIGITYILLNILRSGGDINESLFTIVENIPFGVEFKDYVHSYNTFDAQNIKNYSFGWSAIGSFLNSTILEGFGLNKEELYQMGSQHAWMKLYNEKFGIRLGIVAELYFAYGLFVLPFMVVIAYFSNLINERILTSTTLFKRINYSILFGLFVLLINGQATVFFGCLTIMIYVNLLYYLIKLFTKRKKFINPKKINSFR